MNVRCETIKLLEKNIGSKLLDVSFGCNFFSLFNAESKATKAKINKWKYITLEKLYTAKEAINIMKRHPTE